MIRFLADENFNGRILRGLKRRSALIDVVRAQDVGLYGEPDQRILAWSAAENRILLSHDVSTIAVEAFERVDKGLPMPGVIHLQQDAPIASAIEELILIAACGEEHDFRDKVLYAPL